MLDKSNKRFPYFFINGKRGQIGETMTWIVATIVIIIILLISIFISKGISSSDARILILTDKQKDFIGTKSIVNFVNENLEIVENSFETDNYIFVEEKFKPFLDDLDVFRGFGGWNMELSFNGDKKLEIINYPEIHRFIEINEIIFNLDENKEIRFWEVCKGLCR